MTVATDGPIVEGESPWLARLKQNSRSLSMAGGALVVVAAGVWLYASSQARKERFASQELVRARDAAEAGNLPLATSDFTRVIERFGGTRAADEAVIMLNQVRLIQGQAQVVVPALQEFVRGRRPEYVKASAYGLLGGGLEDLGRFREAADAYRQASSLTRQDYLKAQFLLDAGRALAIAGDSAAARESYGEVLTRFGALEQAAEARVRFAELGGELPLP
jgi:tetratricopeptide (TPR) repeat protein